LVLVLLLVFFFRTPELPRADVVPCPGGEDRDGDRDTEREEDRDRDRLPDRRCGEVDVGIQTGSGGVTNHASSAGLDLGVFFFFVFFLFVVIVVAFFFFVFLAPTPVLVLLADAFFLRETTCFFLDFLVAVRHISGDVAASAV
jgi:hypothetical protein